MSTAARYMGAILALVCLAGLSLSPAQAKGEAAFQTGFDEWNSFSGWTLSGVSLDGAGKLVFDPATAAAGSDPYPAGGYYGGNYYNGGNFYLGEALGPEMAAAFAFKELIASWNAETPLGSWVEVQARAKLGTRWTKWYSLGVWTANNDDAVKRHSVKLQGDADGYVAVDTLVISAKKAAVSGYQLKARLFSADGSAVPSVRYLSAAYSSAAPKKVAVSSGNPAYWNTLLAVPECSQMVYPDGGNVWCSPTSVSMVLGFYGVSGSSCEERVRAAVAGVYDWIYDGHGNWPFNTAYAATYGFQASVRRFTSLNQVEELVAQGIPVVFSFAWSKGQLTGAAVPSSAGHLSVIVGFTASGDPIVNDPAAAADEDVQRTYPRAELEKLWLTNSAGTVYVIELGE